MNHLTALQAADATIAKPGAGRAKSVIFVFLSGGLTQHDSFDPKPDAGETDVSEIPVPSVASSSWMVIPQ